MKKLMVFFIIACISHNCYSQDSMNKKMENKTDKMNKKPVNPNDPMNKKPGNMVDTPRLKKSDTLKRKSLPK